MSLEKAVTKLWLPALCLMIGVMFAKLAELSWSDWTGRSTSYPLQSWSNSSIPMSYPVVQPSQRENAAFIVLSRNSDLYGLAKSIRSVEDRFNHKYAYDWVFLNDDDFDEEFISVTSSLVSGRAKYGRVLTKHWSYPSWIDQSKAAEVRTKAAGVYKYGDSESYRHMCRFFSGFFFRHDLLLQYDYYWRVEPDIELWCDLDFDPFRYLREQKKKISFVISLSEIPETIPSLWKTVKGFFKENPKLLARNSSRKFLSDDGGKTYNGCHFWSNFEIGSFDWLRSPEYLALFEHLDKAGGFYYERWGDAPVHSIAAGLLLNQTDIHFFNEIGYSHDLYTHCPTGLDLQRQRKCYCNPAKNFDWGQLSCLSRYYDMTGTSKPEGYERELALVQAEERKLDEAEAAYVAAEAEEVALRKQLEEMKTLLAKKHPIGSKKVEVVQEHAAVIDTVPVTGEL